MLHRDTRLAAERGSLARERDRLRVVAFVVFLEAECAAAAAEMAKRLAAVLAECHGAFRDIQPWTFEPSCSFGLPGHELAGTQAEDALGGASL